LVEVLAKKSCEWDAPGRPGWTIGSSFSRWLNLQATLNWPVGAACATVA
jgi:hypothetical protein